MPTLLAVLATLIIVPATIGLLLNIGFSGFFFRSPPRGDAAMGLVIPLVINIAAVVALTVAAFLLVVRPGSGGGSIAAQLPVSGGVAGTAVVLLTLGGSLAAFMALLLWCEPAILAGRAEFLRIAACWLAGIFGPLLLALFLLLQAWLPGPTLTNSPMLGRAVFVLTACVTILALGGYVAAVIGFGTPVARHARESAAKARAVVANAAGVTPTGRPISELLQRDMDELTADTPLSRIIAFLPNTPDTIHLNKSCKQIVIKRALRIPPVELDRQLADCMRSRSYHDIRAAGEFLTLVDEEMYRAHAEIWSRALATGVDTCAGAMELRPGWLNERFDGNTDPHATIASLIAAADRLKRTSPAYHPPVAASLQRLADATHNLTANSALRKLQTALTKAGYPPASASPAIPPSSPLGEPAGAPAQVP